MKMKPMLAMALALALIFSFSAYGNDLDLSDYEDYEIHFFSEGQETGLKYGVVYSSAEGSRYVVVDNLSFSEESFPVKEGYHLEGWYTENGIKVSEGYVMTDKMLNLYAHWCKKYDCGKDVYAYFNEKTGELTVCGNGPMNSLKNAKSYPWFSIKSSITSLLVEEGVTEIGAHAFESYSSIKKVVLPESIAIGKNAFKKVPLE